MIAPGGRPWLQRNLVSVLLASAAFVGAADAQTSSGNGAAQSLELPPVSVQGQGETGSSPVNGFVAHMSATGTKTDTPLIETPQSISVIGQNQIQDIGAQTVSQALGYTSGVQPQPFGFDSRYDQFLIRGFLSSQFGNYRDGLRQGNGSFAFFRNEPYELERVEVFKGPTSVLYGGNNPGGLVNVVSKLPPTQPLHEIQMTLGNYNRYQGGFDLGGPVDSEGRVLYRITGFARDSDTQVPDTKYNRIAIAPAMTVRIGDSTTLTLLTEYQKNQESMWPYYLYIPNQGLTNIRLGDPAFDSLNQQQWSVGYKLEHRVNDVITLRQNARYGRVYFDGKFVDALGFVPPVTVTRYSGEWKERLSNFDIDNQAQFNFNTGQVSHTVLTGVDYFGQQFDSKLGLGIAPSLNILNPVYSAGPIRIIQPTTDVYQTLDQVGIYAQDQMVWRGWHLTLSGREDLVHTTSENRLRSTTTADDPKKFTGRAGLLYLFDNGVAPYVSYSTSFLPTPGTGSPLNGSQPFVPTTGQQYEVGVKYQPPGTNSYLTASLFNITQQNVLTTDPVNPQFSVQTGEVRSRGFELEAVASLGFGLNGIASYTYVDALNTKSNSASLNKVPIAVPQSQAAMFVDYSAPPEGRLAGFGAGAGVRYIGDTFANATNTQRNDPIAAYDLLLRQDIDKFRLQLNINNITDRRVAVCNSGNCTWSLGRVILGTVRVRW